MRRFKEVHLGQCQTSPERTKGWKEPHLLQATIKVVTVFFPIITRKAFLETSQRLQIKSQGKPYLFIRIWISEENRSTTWIYIRKSVNNMREIRGDNISRFFGTVASDLLAD
jgi:hypothetical protein